MPLSLPGALSAYSSSSTSSLFLSLSPKRSYARLIACAIERVQVFLKHTEQSNTPNMSERLPVYPLRYM